MTTRYRKMQMEGWGVSGGEWEELTDDDIQEKFPDRAASVLDTLLNDHQMYVEIERNGGWRPASIRTLPMWQHASTLEITNLEQQAEQLRRQAGNAYRAQGELLEQALRAVKEAEDRLREQRVRVDAGEERLKADTSKAKKLEAEAASKRRDLGKRLAVSDAASSPAPEPIPA
jgi:hypothetical protein